MGIFGKNHRPEKAPELHHQPDQLQQQQQSPAKRSPGPALKFFSVNGRRRKNSNDSLSTLNSTPAPALGVPHQLGNSRLGRSVDSLPLALSQHQSPGQSHRPASSVSLHPRHAVSPLAQCASHNDAPESPAAASATGGKARAFNKLFRKTHRNTDSSASSSTLSVPQSSSTSSGGSPKRLSRGATEPSPTNDEFNLKSFRSVSSPLVQQQKQWSTDSDYAAKPALSPLHTPPAIADDDDLPLHAPAPSYANKPRSSSVSSMPILFSSSSSPGPSRPASPGWRGSVTASQFQQAKPSSAARSSNTSLRTTPSSTSLAQLTNLPEPSSASSMPPTPKSPGSRPPSKLDLPLPTPTRVAPSKPLPSRRSSAVDANMDVYNDYFSSPVSSPAVATHNTKHALFGNANPSPAARDQALRASPKSSEILTLESSPTKPNSALPGAGDGLSNSTTARPSPSVTPGQHHHPGRSLSGTNLLSAASTLSSSVVNYINSWEEPLEGGGGGGVHKPQPSASSNVSSMKPSGSSSSSELTPARERRKSKAVGTHAWGADSDSDSDDSDQGGHQKASSSDGGRSDGGLQLNVKGSQSSMAARQQQKTASASNAAWESDSAVIKREEARKQALLAQSSPFTRSSFLPPQPVARPLQPTTNIQPSPQHQHKRSSSSQSVCEPDKPRHSPTPSRVSPHHEYQQYGQAPLDEGNLEVLNSQEGESAVDDDDETPLARVTSHRRSQSDLCVPTIGRMSQLNASSSAMMQPSKSAQKHASDAPEGVSPRASLALDSQQHHRQSQVPMLSKTAQDMHGRMQAPMHQQPSLSDLVHAYRNVDGHAPVTLSPPTLGGGPRFRGSQMSISSKGSKRSFSAHDLPKPSLGSSLGGPAGSSRMSIASTDSTSVHERMRSRHKDAMRGGAGLVQVDKPSGSLPPPTPTVRPSPAPQMVPSLSAGSVPQLQMPMNQMPYSPESDAAPPGIDSGLWATLPPDQRLNLTMRSNAMMQMQMQQMQQMAAMQAQMQFAMQNMSAAGSSMGVPSSGSAMSYQQQPWGTGSIMGFPPLPAHGSNMSTTSGARKSQAYHSFINQQ